MRQTWDRHNLHVVHHSLDQLTLSSPTLTSHILTDHGQTSATFCCGSKIGRHLAVVGSRHAKWLAFSSHNLTNHGQTSAIFCLRSKIGRRLAVIVTHHGNLISHSYRPRPDVGNFCLRSKIRRCLAVVGTRHCNWTSLSSPTLTDHGQTSATFYLRSKIGRRLAVVGPRHGMWTHLLFSYSLMSPSSNFPFWPTTARRRQLFVSGQKFADVWPS